MNRNSPSRMSRVLDGALEATIVGSFTSWGWAARRRLFGWDQEESVDLSGRVAIVTGATNGMFWHDRRPRSTTYLPNTRMSPVERSRLWDWCEDQVAIARAQGGPGMGSA